MLWKIILDTDDPVIDFAAEELKRYLSEIDCALEAVILRGSMLKFKSADAVHLSVDTTLLPPDSDCFLDDAICIDVHNGCGKISGSNTRSVLIAVYRFLRELGCVWVRPGRKNEIIPQKSLECVCVSVNECPSYRHRGVVIEGAVSYEHVVNMIDWLPKMGMNSYFIQFSGVPFVFYDRWYSHICNELMKPEPLSADEIYALKEYTVEQIKKRGLIYHAAGHGWTCESLGIPGYSWDSNNVELTDEQRSALALIDGKRELFGDVALNTNLCYSAPSVRNTIVRSVVNYCKQNKTADVVHLWLADCFNNHCECAECRKKIPSDWYVILLNELDLALTKNGLRQKIVFLVYNDLLWSPEKERLNNTDRFIMMFAPITRTYSTSITDLNEYDFEHLPGYVRNRLSFPTSVEENIAHLRKWQKNISCDGFDFDYHYMWDHFNDPGYYRMAQILLEDIKGLRKIGLNGLMSCQLQRVWFPCGLGMHIMANALWNENIDFENAAKDYFVSTFGCDGMSVKDYLCRISDIFNPCYMRNETGTRCESDAIRLSSVSEIVDRFSGTIQAHSDCPTLPESIRMSWRILAHHGKYCVLLADALINEIRNPEKAGEGFEALYCWCKHYETMYNDVLDNCLLQSTFGKRYEK